MSGGETNLRTAEDDPRKGEAVEDTTDAKTRLSVAAQDSLKVGTTIKKPIEKQPEDNPFRIEATYENPVARALALRVGIHGLRGELLINKESALSLLKKTGPLGEQLVARAATMEAQGWSIGRLTWNDPYLKAAFPNPIKKAAVYLPLAGYNAGYYEGTPIKRVTYNSWSHLINQTLTGSGRSSPATRVVGNLAHEIGHFDRVPLPEISELPKLSPMERRVVANRLLQTETNALLPQLYASQKMGAYHPEIEVWREALKQGRLGSAVRNHWIKFGQGYDVFKDITPAEADAMVKSHLEANYKGVVQKSGRIAEYDLASVRGKYAGTTSLDATILKRLDDATPGVKVPEGSLARWASSGTRGQVLRAGGQALGGLGVALIGSDIAAGFYEGEAQGYGKVGRAGFNLLTYEAGSLAGSTAGAIMIRLSKGRIAPIVLPAATILVGVTASAYTDVEYGTQVEKFFQDLKPNTYDELYKTRYGKKPGSK